ncbi:hypothetical protein BGZ74_010559 [Mortierella antarctica]|nr:hypothetical protein BGZ74_010559 [Mortierella antarctica]
MELEDKMMNGVRLSAEDSRELGQLTGAGSALLVKRDSCPNCQKDYQCALLSCDDFFYRRPSTRVDQCDRNQTTTTSSHYESASHLELLLSASSLTDLTFKNVQLQHAIDWEFIVHSMGMFSLGSFSLCSCGANQLLSTTNAVGPILSEFNNRHRRPSIKAMPKSIPQSHFDTVLNFTVLNQFSLRSLHVMCGPYHPRKVNSISQILQSVH